MIEACCSGVVALLPSTPASGRGSLPRNHPGAARAIRGEHAMETDEVHAGGEPAQRLSRSKSGAN